MEAAADRLIGDTELGPGLGVPRVQFLERLLNEIIGTRAGIRLEVSAGAVALDGVAPFGNVPLELGLRLGRRLRQINLHAGAGRLDIADIDEAGQRGGPEPSDGTAAGVERQVVLGAGVVP